MENNIKLLEGKVELLNEIEGLWHKLNKHHISSAEHFKEKYLKFTFEARLKSLVDKASAGDILVLIASHNDCEIGYCVSTVDSEGIGEIDSLFVEQEYRKLKIGDMLMTRSLQWLESKIPKEIVLTVAGGNEKVLDFYKRYGFYTTAVKLVKVDENLQKTASNNEVYIISTDKSMLKLDDIICLLGNSYWAADRSKEKIVKSIENSLCFGVYHDNKQIGFARMITDYATHAYLCDVIIDESYRGHGIGKSLMSYIMEYPALQGIKTMCLMTNDAHKLYEKYGFGNMKDPGKFMIKRTE